MNVRTVGTNGFESVDGEDFWWPCATDPFDESKVAQGSI